MRRSRKTFQNGWIERRRTAAGVVYAYRWRDRGPSGHVKRSLDLGPPHSITTMAEAWEKAGGLKLSINPGNPHGQTSTFGALIDLYLKEEPPERGNTNRVYRSYIEQHIRPRWSSEPLTTMAENPLVIEKWLNALDLAAKTRGNIRAVMQTMFKTAMRWKLLPRGENPMSLVRVKGVSKSAEGRALEIDSVRALLAQLPDEPYRMMVLFDVATGLRVSELLGLMWADFDFANGSLLVRRSWTEGQLEDVKTRYSRAGLPLDPALIAMFQAWRQRSSYPLASDFVFASPRKRGRQPLSPNALMDNHIMPAAKRAGIHLTGWHDFRRTFSSLLRANGEDIKVQQELMRHADIRTTMNIYTRAVTSQKREAHSRIVQMMFLEEPTGSRCPIAPDAVPRIQ